ncbi:MAG: TolC family protein, partial [Bacteroidota bacterium]
MKKYLLLGLGWLWALASWSQTEEVILTYDEYLQMVLEDHPVAKQAQLKMDLAEAQWLSAKGGFDPMIESNFDQKHFDQKRYYRHFQSRLSVPTRLGIDLVAGYENTEGIFLNPEKTTDPKGLWNLGVEVNVLQGLLVNERRMALQQAQIFRQMSENQQASMLNDLLFGASMVYLDWQKYFSFQGILNENLALAQVYFESTKLSFENGEKTAIDTLEAMIMMQDATNLIQSNDALLTKAKQNLDNFLWQDDLPRTLTVPLIPQTYTQALSTFSDSSAVVDWINTHPE